MATAFRRLHIAQVNTSDLGGGAERVAYELLKQYRSLGHESRLIVGFKKSSDEDVLILPRIVPERQSKWAQWCMSAIPPLVPLLKPLARRVRAEHVARVLGKPAIWFRRRAGIEDFDFPGAWQIPQLLHGCPDIIHCHNLHHHYFDLRALPYLASIAPLVLTLHDAWLLAGNCAHSFDCERWKTGCGACPDIGIYPGLVRDGTAGNWQRKKEILAGARFNVCSPSKWLLSKARQSLLASQIADARVIPNGIDQSVFRPMSQSLARRNLGLPAEARIVLLAANGIRENRWKDFRCVRAAMERIGNGASGQGLLFLALGDEAPGETIGQARLEFRSYEQDPERVASFYQAADIYVHAARADNCPLAVLEALSCGLPVVATAVGGIPELVRGWTGGRTALLPGDGGAADDTTATGILIGNGDHDALAESIEILLQRPAFRRRLGENASRDARGRFSIGRQALEQLLWYSEISAERVRIASGSAI